MTRNPKTELQQGFSSEGATATPWEEVSALMEKAKIYWLTTVRSNGQPNTSPLYAVWLDDTFYFATGPDERKSKNLAQNTKCNITTGCNVVEGTDIVVEGEAMPVSDEALLHTLSAQYVAKYDWQYEVQDGAFMLDGHRTIVFAVAPVTAFSFGKSEPFSQTRYKF